MAIVTTLSIVVPSYNDAAMLHHCLAALAVQTRPPDEVIVVDNGSTDGTAAVAREAEARVVSEPARGVLRATAAGFDAATGDVIGRLDADSRPAHDWCARVLARFEQDPTLDVLTGTGTFYGGGPFWHAVGRHVYIGGYLQFMRAITGHLPVFGSNFAMRRAGWDRISRDVHRGDPRMHDDLDLSMVMAPDMAVDADRSLEVWVSARPFEHWAGFGRRASWAFHDIAVNWSEDPWGRRLAESALAGVRRRARRSGLGEELQERRRQLMGRRLAHGVAGAEQAEPRPQAPRVRAVGAGRPDVVGAGGHQDGNAGGAQGSVQARRARHGLGDVGHRVRAREEESFADEPRAAGAGGTE